MVSVINHPEGCLIRVRAMPGARRTGVVGELAGALKVAVTAPAQDGRANTAIVEALREALGLKRSQVELTLGHASRNKTVLLRGVTQADISKRIAELL